MATNTAHARGRRGGQEADSAVGPLLGQRRPKYEILNDTLGEWLTQQPPGEVYVFVNLNHLLRPLFSEYALARVSANDLRRAPRALAAELTNLVGHYRNYLWTRHGRQTTVALYHSTEKCPDKLGCLSDYKAELYARRIDEPPAELASMRAYVDFNLRVLRPLLERTPNAYLVDTGELDPEAWPWALMVEGRCPGPRIILSGWRSDIQYALAPGGHATAILRANGDHTRVAAGEGALADLLRESKTGADLVGELAPGHLPYLLSLCGDDDLGAPGLQKTGPHRAAQLVIKRSKEGFLPPAAPSLQALLEEAGLTDLQKAQVATCWHLTNHADHVARVATPALMAQLDTQMVDLSGLGELEASNSRYFGGALNLDMLYAGEEY